MRHCHLLFKSTQYTFNNKIYDKKNNEQDVGKTISTETNFAFSLYFVHKFTHSRYHSSRQTHSIRVCLITAFGRRCRPWTSRQLKANYIIKIIAIYLIGNSNIFLRARPDVTHTTRYRKLIYLNNSNFLFTPPSSELHLTL